MRVAKVGRWWQGRVGVGKVGGGGGKDGGESFMSGWKAIIVLCFVIDLLVLRFKAGLSAQPSHSLSVSPREAVF